MRRFTLWLTVVLLVLGSPAPLFAFTDYYVATSGDDTTGDGSSGNPWRTITKGLTVAGSGDTVHVAAGTYDAAGGESFPLLLFGESLVGAGRDVTRIEADNDDVMLVLDEAPAAVLEGFEFEQIDVGPPGGLPLLRLGDDNPAAIRNNRFIADRAIYGVRSGAGGFRNVVVSSNEAFDADNPGRSGDFIELGAAESATVRKNIVTGFDRAIFLDAGESPDFVTVASNQIFDPQSTGIVIDGFLGVPRELVIERNEIDGAGASGVYIDLLASGQFGDLTGSLRYNSIVNCANAGMKLNLGAVSSSDTSGIADKGLLRFLAPIAGNVITDNGGRGLSIRGYAGQSHVVQLPDAGTVRYPLLNGPNPPAATGSSTFVGAPAQRLTAPGAGSPTVRLGPTGYAGRNMLKRNGSFQAYGVYSGFVTKSVQMHGNWWGSTNPKIVETLIWDSNDDPAQQMYIEAGVLLKGIMGVKLSTNEAGAAGGQRIVVYAKPNAAFVEAVGLTDIAVTLGGVPVDNLQLAESGLRLKFDTPALPVGPATLLIQNPNGTSATKTVQIVP